jgi:magnesium transporter
MTLWFAPYGLAAFDASACLLPQACVVGLPVQPTHADGVCANHATICTFERGSPVHSAAMGAAAAPKVSGGRHTCLVLEQGGVVRHLPEAQLDQLDRLAASPGTVVWLDIADPGSRDLELLQHELGLHALAIEDLQTRRQRPKIDTYRGHHVIVTYEVRDGKGRQRGTRHAAYDLGEIHLIASPRYLVSVHWGASPVVDDVAKRLDQRASAIGHAVGAILYAILDAVVDGYFPLLDQLSDRIDDLEDEIVSGQQGPGTLREVLTIKRELLELRRVLAPQRDVANRLLRRDIELLDDEAAPYYQDLYDHLVRVLDALDLYRDLVASTLDANLSVTSNTLNAVMKRLTAFTVVLMLPTLVASVYGMNFTALPGLASPIAFWITMALMAVLMVGAAVYFRAMDWF